MSRCPSDSEPTDKEIHYFSYLEDLPITSNKLAEATRNDIILARVYDFTVNGWPDAVNLPDLQPFVLRKNELTTEGGCLLWGRRIIIPNKYRQQLLDDLHEVHPGMCRMKSLARSYLWWPSLDQDIEEKVRNCQTCMSLRNSPPLSPLKPWTWPKNPWQRIHIDFAEFQKQQFLIVIDSHSKWIEVFPMRSTTSFKTIETLRSLFATYGLPEDVVSDNGPQFTSKEFKDFLQNNGVRQILTPPYHPASNGAAERTVQIVKQSLMKQVMHGNRNQTLQHRLDNFLLTYRITPHTVTGYAPCELFLKRGIRNRFTLLKPNLAKSVEDKQNLQKKGHDVKTRVRTFQEGQIVSVKDFRGDRKRWIPWRITRKLGENTFLVRTGGRTRYCHIDHLLPNVETRIMDYQDDVKKDFGSKSILNDTDLDFPVFPIPEVQPNRNDPVNFPIQNRRYPVRVRQAPDRLDILF